MGYIPSDAEWFIGQLILEIIVEGDPRNVVHVNTTLIKASSSEEAYSKALQFGQKSETQYENMTGHRVDIRFKGLAMLDVIDEGLQDGSEIMFRQFTNLNQEALSDLIVPKERLAAFTPPQQIPGPDYRAKYVVELALNSNKPEKE